MGGLVYQSRAGLGKVKKYKKKMKNNMNDRRRGGGVERFDYIYNER